MSAKRRMSNMRGRMSMARTMHLPFSVSEDDAVSPAWPCPAGCGGAECVSGIDRPRRKLSSGAPPRSSSGTLTSRSSRPRSARSRFALADNPVPAVADGRARTSAQEQLSSKELEVQIGQMASSVFQTKLIELTTMLAKSNAVRCQARARCRRRLPR
jgi:hypothetical protein